MLKSAMIFFANLLHEHCLHCLERLSKCAEMISLFSYILRGLTGIGGGVGLAGVHDWMVDTCWAAPPDSARLRHTRQSPHTTHPPSRTSTTTRSQTLNTGVQCLETSNCDINVHKSPDLNTPSFSSPKSYGGAPKNKSII